MPHRCVRCDQLYSDSAPEVMTGCACGAKIFLFVRPDQQGSGVRTLREGKYEVDVRALLGRRGEGPVTSSAEGRYDVDLAAAFAKRPNV